MISKLTKIHNFWIQDILGNMDVPIDLFEKAVLKVLLNRIKNRDTEAPIKIEIEMDPAHCLMIFYIDTELVKNSNLEEKSLLDNWQFNTEKYHAFIINKHYTDIDDALDSNTREIGVQILKSFNEKANTSQILTLNNVENVIDKIYDGIFE